MKFLSHAFVSLILWIPLAAPIGARANTEELVTSIQHGGNPYMIVTEDKEGGSLRAPGIYGRTKDAWRLILGGAVLQEDRKGFWVKQLKLSRKDEAYHSLMVVDQSLVLINLGSDPNVPGSILRIGTSEFPLVEVLTGQKRTLPRISAPDDISYFALESNLDELDYQLIFVSVRCESCGGNGLTFALGVKAMKESGKYELVGKPWLIDYKYYSQAELGKLAHYEMNGRSYSIRSGVAQDFVFNTDTSHFQAHQKIVDQKLAEFSEAASKADVPQITVDLATGQLSRSLIPTVKFEHEIFKLIQQYDLRSLAGKLTISTTEPGEMGSVAGSKVMPALLDFRQPGVPAVFGSADGTTMIFSADDRLYYARHDSKVNVVELGPSPVLGDTQIFDHVVPLKPEEGMLARYLLFLSSINGAGGTVDVYRIGVFKTGAMVMEDHLKLGDVKVHSFDLAKRVRTIDGKILFDSITREVESEEEYDQIFDRKQPLVNVLESREGSQAYAFAEPVEAYSTRGYYEYRVYADSPLISRQSGFYSHNSSVLGQLLSVSAPEGTEATGVSNLFELQDFATESGVYSVEVAALDSSFKNGSSNFKIVIAVSRGEDEKRAPPTFITIPVKVPFANFRSIKIAPMRKSNGRFLAVAISTDAQYGTEGGLTQVATIELNSADKGGPKLGNFTTVTKESLDQVELNRRMIHDEEGRVYFVTNPKIARDDRRLELVDIRTGHTVKPNADGKPLRLIWDIKEDDGHWNTDRRNGWRVTPYELEKRYPFISRRLRDAEASYLWGKLFTLLDEMARARTSDKMTVLLVPADMKKYVNELIFTRYGRVPKGSDDPDGFSVQNRALNLYHFDPDKAAQDEILENLESIQRQGSSRNVVIADMAHITRVNRPHSKTVDFQISKVNAADDAGFGEDVATQEEKTVPHALYLMGLGDFQQPEDFFGDPKPRAYSTLLVATPEEWEEAQEQARLEMDLGLDKLFEVREFPLPTPEDRARLLTQVFEDRSFASRKFTFSAAGISARLPSDEDGHLKKLLEYAVMRVASEAENAHQDALNAFVQFRNAFVQQLLKDKTLLRTRTVDKAFIERVLTSVFDIPVNLEALPPDDPIFVLSRKDAVRQLQDRGVMGPFAIKARMVKTMLSVLKFDPTRSIPSSHIAIGESGSGKTRMITGILDWLFPVRYDFNNPTKNGEANSLRINVGKLIEGKREGRTGDQMGFEELKEHINNFLINGYRGAIFFDDFHAAPESVRTQLLTFLRTLLETQGMYNTTTIYSEQPVNVPLRHLHLFIALNPTESVTQIDQFRKDKTQPATFEEVLLASLSTKDYKVERSLLKRIGCFHNMLKFPHGAKAPALGVETLKVARDVMLRKQKLVINSAGSIKAVADAFPLMDARTFISTASSSLVDQVDPQLYRGTLFQVVPGFRRLPAGDVYDDSEQGKIEEFIQRNTKVLPISENNIESQLHFLSSLVRNFRLPLLEQFLISLEDDPRFSESIDNQRSFLLPSMMAMRGQVVSHPEIPLKELGLDPSGFGLKTSGDRALFKDLLADFARMELRHFPFPIPRNEREEGWDVLLTGASAGVGSSRLGVITRYYQKLQDVLQRYAKRFYNLESLEGMPDSEKWLRRLPSKSHEANLKPQIDEIRELFWKFLTDINDPTLRERSQLGEGHLTPYAIARIYYFLIDKAIIDLPWIPIEKHLIRALDYTVQDQVLGQSPGIKDYFFDYKYSPIRAATPELILQLVESSQLGNEYPVESQARIHEGYQEYCARLVKGGQP